MMSHCAECWLNLVALQHVDVIVNILSPFRPGQPKYTVAGECNERLPVKVCLP